MASYEQDDFSRGPFAQDGGLTHHFSMACEPRFGHSISLLAEFPDPYDASADSISQYTPRTLGPHPDYVPTFSPYDYRHGQTYTISSASTSARRRSDSEASTTSAGYIVASPMTTPTSPYTLNGAGSQYQSTYYSPVINSAGSASSSWKQTPRSQAKQELIPAQKGGSSNPASER